MDSESAFNASSAASHYYDVVKTRARLILIEDRVARFR